MNSGLRRQPFGCKLHGLPIKYMSMEAGIKICEVVGEVVRPTETRLFDAGNFIRLQMSIDTSLPLCHGRLISLHDGKQIKFGSL